MIDYLWNNKEWLFSGLGVSVLVAVVWIARQIINRRKAVEPSSPQAVQPEPAAQQVEGSSSSLSGKEIIQDVEGRPLYQQAEAARHYVGLKVRWKLNVVSVRSQDETESSARLYCNANGDYPWVSARDISLAKHPELKFLKKGAEIWVCGTIERVHGRDIDLNHADIG